MLLREIGALVESTGDLAFAVDGSVVIVAWNSAAEALFGVTDGETMGKPVWRAERSEDPRLAKARWPLDETLQRGGVTELPEEVVVRRRPRDALDR